jgi:hypothetical protein
MQWEIKVKHNSLPSALGNQGKTQQPAICNGKSKLNTTACHLQWEIKVKYKCLPSAI